MSDIIKDGGISMDANVREWMISKFNEIKPIKEVEYDLIGDLLKYGKMTGSRAWGVGSRYSDVDIIVPPSCHITFDDMICRFSGYYLHQDPNSNGNGYHGKDFDLDSVYVICNGVIYNILFITEEEGYAEWAYATDKISEMIQQDIALKMRIRNKQVRVELFEKLKKQYVEKGE